MDSNFLADNEIKNGQHKKDNRFPITIMNILPENVTKKEARRTS